MSSLFSLARTVVRSSTHAVLGSSLVDEAGAGSGACAAGWGVVVSIASQGSRARGRREEMGRTDTHTEGNASRATLFHNHNMCALHHFWPVVWEGRGSSASPGGKGIEQ